MIQICILIFGYLAIKLSQSSNPLVSRYACIFGLISQPFFLISTYQKEQWGMFLLAILITHAYIQGFRNFWLNGQDNFLKKLFGSG